MRQILVPVDFSATTDAVVEAAADLAKAFEASLTLLNVAPREPDVFGVQLTRKVIEDPVPEDVQDRYENLKRLGAQLAEQGLQCELRLIRGDRVGTVLAEAERISADGIVMGSHGRGGLYRRLVGSVSEGVLKDGRFPVLVIPTRAREAEQTKTDKPSDPE